MKLVSLLSYFVKTFLFCIFLNFFTEVTRPKTASSKFSLSFKCNFEQLWSSQYQQIHPKSISCLEKINIESLKVESQSEPQRNCIP